jgi:hypothetical protein
MKRVHRGRRALQATFVLCAAALLSGSYCTNRGYYVPGSVRAKSEQVSSGPISRFGSVYVNGTEFADGSASLTINGVAAAESNLLPGQIAAVTGTTSSAASATATSITVFSKVVGAVATVDLSSHSLTVLGQTISITGDTSIGTGISPADPGGIAVGTIVTVDGYRTSTGYLATRIDVAAAGACCTISGVLTNLDASTSTFTVAGTTVDYSATSLPASVTNGTYVTVTGTAGIQSATLSASAVSAATETTAGSTGQTGTVSGAITSYTSALSFSVAGQTVVTSSGTTNYNNGSTATLAADIPVTVTGTYDSSGNLNATSVTFLSKALVRVAGSVTAIDASAGTITLNGVATTTTSDTRWDDRSGTAIRTFALGDVNVGDWIDVWGVDGTSAGTMTAHLVQRETTPSPARVILQDVATVVAGGTLKLAGVAVDASSATFTDVNGNALTAATFATLAPGALIRASGTLSAGVLVAQTISLRQ